MSILNFFRNRNNNNKDRYILCIDGGGMRGIVPVMILQKLEELLRKNGANRPVQSYFDFIAGTSTGGLIASGLVFPDRLQPVNLCGQNQIKLQDLEQIYMTVGNIVFPPAQGILGFVNKPHQVIADKYSVDGIEKTLENWFGDTKLCEASVPLLLMAYNLSEGKAALLTSYSENKMTVAQACRATSAAPTYFAPLTFEDNMLADGGVIANNPSLYAYIEAKKLYPDCKKFHILSIGTASHKHKTEPNEVSGLISWVEQVSPMYTTAQKQTAEDVISSLDDVEYLRLDKEFSQEIKMDDIRQETLENLREFGVQIASDYSEELENYVDELIRERLR